MAVNKLLKGLKNIHFAPYVEGEFQTPIRIAFAKAIEGKLNYESEPEWGDDVIVDNSSMFAGGEGNVKVLGLTKEEQVALFGNKAVKGGIAVYSDDNAPVGAFLFERGKKNSQHKRLYAIYACQCAPTGFNGETVEDGKASATVEEIDFTIGQMDDNLVFHYIDTDDTTVETEAKENWFKTVQLPKEISLPASVKEKSIKEEK